MWDGPFPSCHCGGAGTGQSWVWTGPGSLANPLVSSDQAASAGLDLVTGSSPICCTISSGHSQDNSLDTTFSSDAAPSGHTLCDSGFVPYYRTPEEKLHTSLEPAAKRPQDRCPGPVPPHCKDPKPAAARVGPPAPAHR